MIDVGKGRRFGMKRLSNLFQTLQKMLLPHDPSLFIILILGI